MLEPGTHRLGPESGRILVTTSRTGMGAKAGHDLTIEVTRWEVVATVAPSDPARSSVSVSIDVDSLEVREGTGGIKPLADADRAEIKRTISERILHTAEHPRITFRSTQVAGTPESFTVDGSLTIRDVTRPVTVLCAVSDDGRARGKVTVTQSQWGIKPYSAFFGALKLKDDVEVSFDLRLAGG